MSWAAVWIGWKLIAATINTSDSILIADFMFYFLLLRIKFSQTDLQLRGLLPGFAECPSQIGIKLFRGIVK